MEILFAVFEKYFYSLNYFSLVLHNPYYGPDKYPVPANYWKTLIYKD
jgi:hypothetical protein